MDRDTIVEVFKQYSLEAILNIEDIQRGVSKITTTTGKKYIIINNSLEIIEKQYNILSKLKKLNVPVAPILETMKGMCYVEINKFNRSCYCLYPFIEGANIGNLYSQEGESIVNTLGASIAQLHRGLGQLDFNKDYSSEDFFKRTFGDGLDSILMYEKDSNITSRVKAILSECMGFQSKLNELPVQIIHGDLHSGNILYGDQKVNAFIDFELSTTGYRMYDLGFFMVDIFMQGLQKESDRQWFDLCNQFIKNYHRESALREVELQSLWYFLLAAQFLIVGYFYRAQVFDEARRYLNGLFWIYGNKDRIGEAFTR